MSRVRFRAWDKVTSCWQIPGQVALYSDGNIGVFDPGVYEWLEDSDIKADLSIHLKDKKEEPIHENDSLKVDGYKHPVLVEFQYGAFGWCLRHFQDFVPFVTGPFADNAHTIVSNVEIIGNLCDNPELLKNTNAD